MLAPAGEEFELGKRILQIGLGANALGDTVVEGAKLHPEGILAEGRRTRQR